MKLPLMISTSCRPQRLNTRTSAGMESHSVRPSPLLLESNILYQLTPLCSYFPPFQRHLKPSPKSHSSPLFAYSNSNRFVEQRIDELLEATAKALLPRPTTLRQRHSVGAIPPRQAAGSPTWVSTKGYGSEGSKSDMGCSGGSGGDAEEEGGRLLTVKVCVCVCVFIKLYTTAQSGPGILLIVILCYSPMVLPRGIKGSMEHGRTGHESSIDDQTRQRGHTHSLQLLHKR